MVSLMQIPSEPDLHKSD